MVKLVVRNGKLFRIATNEIQISSATIIHYKDRQIYEVEVFPINGKNKVYKQKKYPLENIQLEKSKLSHTEERPFFVGKGTYYYINYYVK